MTATPSPRVFLDISIGGEPTGRLTIELFVDQVPKTCENFRQICTGVHNGLNYVKAPFHRVIDEFMIQGGDIVKGDGTGTVSIYGEEFEDENLQWRDMDAAGLVCSANRGRDTNGSQFFITLEPCPHLNGKHTIFGRVVAGEETLRSIAKVDVDDDDRPYEAVLIARCGELEKRKKKTAPQPELQKRQSSASRDRGRRRKSGASDREADDTAPNAQQQDRRNRRQSDNVVDEGLRGRPRLRSGSRSASRDRSSSAAVDGAEISSEAEKHKRKRSPSPSRNVGYNDHERRRRSLPNQYDSPRYGKAFDDEDRYRPSRRRDDRGQREDWRRDRQDGDRYRPGRDRHRFNDGGRGGEDGRLGHPDAEFERGEATVKFKGRGIMKYREQ